MRTALLLTAIAAVSLAAPAAAQNRPANKEMCDNLAADFSSAEQVTACTALIKSGTLAPDELASVLDLRGTEYLGHNDYDRAIADFSAAIRIDPKDAGAFYGRGAAETALGRKAEGDADFARAKAIDPDNFGD